MLVWQETMWDPEDKVRGLIRGELEKHFREQALHWGLISFSFISSICARRETLWYPLLPLAVLEVAPASLQLSLCKFATVLSPAAVPGSWVSGSWMTKITFMRISPGICFKWMHHKELVHNHLFDNHFQH